MEIKSGCDMGKVSSRFKECFSESCVCQTETFRENLVTKALTVKREEPWGEIRYDISQHRFSYVNTSGKDAFPYVNTPVLLNIDLTMKCNMNCLHCVAKDFGQVDDLEISRKLLDWINNSPFLVVVITGGEPLLPEYEERLKTLLLETRNKGLIVDTNGTIIPSQSMIETLHDTNTLVRVSWDAVRSYEETIFRRVKSNTNIKDEINKEYFQSKFKLIRRLQESDINIAAQSVLSRENRASIKDMPIALHKYKLKKWYIQRFIPSYMRTDKKYEVSKSEYEEITTELINICQEYNIECITKKDQRHNCVVLLVGKGILYTQGQKPGQKIRLGTIDSDIRYFDFISSADHSERYYG